jgi:hypothetical protein
MLDDQGGTDGATPVATETKHERFLRLAQPRVQHALHALDIVAKLASKQNEYSDEEAEKLIRALRGKINEIEVLMRRKGEEKSAFSFE